MSRSYNEVQRMLKTDGAIQQQGIRRDLRLTRERKAIVDKLKTAKLKESKDAIEKDIEQFDKNLRDEAKRKFDERVFNDLREETMTVVKLVGVVKKKDGTKVGLFEQQVIPMAEYLAQTSDLNPFKEDEDDDRLSHQHSDGDHGRHSRKVRNT